MCVSTDLAEERRNRAIASMYRCHLQFYRFSQIRSNQMELEIQTIMPNE